MNKIPCLPIVLFAALAPATDAAAVAFEAQRADGVNLLSPVGAEWTLSGVGNLDGVGHDDLVWRHSNGQPHVWSIVGGAYRTSGDFGQAPSADWRLRGVGDVDGDGDSDVIWQHKSTQTHIWTMQGGKPAGAYDLYSPVGQEWSLRAVGDVDKDGDDDIIWQYSNTQVHVWRMQSGQRVDGYDIYIPVGADWTLAAAGDVDGDGDDDIIWRNKSNNGVHIWRMQAGQRVAGYDLKQPVGPDWRFTGAGDLDGDGRDEIVWQDVRGQVHYWRMRVDYGFIDEDMQDGDTMSRDAAPKAWLTAAAADWMGYLSDRKSLADVSIPGTHDTGARFGGAACEAHTWTIRQQLDAGIRFLDMRLRRTGQSFSIHHGECYQNMQFGDALAQISAFLAAQPRETIVMRVKEEHDPQEGAETFQQIWDRYMGTYGGYFAPARSNIPTLGDVRGKVFVLRDAAFSGYGISYNSSLTDIQDDYKVYWLANDNPFGADTVSLAQKNERIKEYLDKGGSSSQLILNHLSGAVGMIPFDVARSTNAAAYEKIGIYAGPKKLGILITDFPGDKLVYRVIKSNFQSSAQCAAQTFRAESGASYAEFRLPRSSAGSVIAFKGGAYNNYVFPKCNRVTWDDLRFTCGADAQWSKRGSWDSDALCHDSNTSQPNLAVGDK